MLQKWGLGRAAAVSSALRTLARSAPHARGISKAVGDQAREQVRAGSQENDDDWIKVQDYVRGMNPKFIEDARAANNAAPWRNEGVAAASFQDAAVGGVSTVTLQCSSVETARQTLGALQCIAGVAPEAAGGTGVGEVNIGGTVVRVQLMEGWVQSWRAFRSRPGITRVASLEFSSPESLDLAAAHAGLVERGVDPARPSDGKAAFAPVGCGSSYFSFDSATVAMNAYIDVLPPCFILANPAPPAGPSAPQGSPRVKEVVVGASWKRHGAFERFLDLVCGSAARGSLGVWNLPSGPAVRLVPTDENGLRTVVIHATDVDAVVGRLAASGFHAVAFPKYAVFPVGGLDLRLTSSATVEKFYSEVRWEVDEAVTARLDAAATGDAKDPDAAEGRDAPGVSCVGAITHGAMQSIGSGTLAKKMRSR